MLPKSSPRRQRRSCAAAVEAAVAGVGGRSRAALPRLQPLALTPRTRAAVKATGCLDELRDEIRRVTGADDVPIAELERIKTGTVVTIAVVALALWSLIPQFLGIGSLWGELLAPTGGGSPQRWRSRP
jgi:hypothetical protein